MAVFFLEKGHCRFAMRLLYRKQVCLKSWEDHVDMPTWFWPFGRYKGWKSGPVTEIKIH